MRDTGFGGEGSDRAYHWGRMSERDAIVAWLRRNPGVSRGPECVTAMTPFESADAIERGAHLKEKP